MLERRFYPFAVLDWLPLPEARARALATGEPMHCVALSGSLTDESCWGSGKTLRARVLSDAAVQAVLQFLQRGLAAAGRPAIDVPTRRRTAGSRPPRVLALTPEQPSADLLEVLTVRGFGKSSFGSWSAAIRVRSRWRAPHVSVPSTAEPTVPRRRGDRGCVRVALASDPGCQGACAGSPRP